MGHWVHLWPGFLISTYSFTMPTSTWMSHHHISQGAAAVQANIPSRRNSGDKWKEERAVIALRGKVSYHLVTFYLCLVSVEENIWPRPTYRIDWLDSSSALWGSLAPTSPSMPSNWAREIELPLSDDCKLAMDREMGPLLTSERKTLTRINKSVPHCYLIYNCPFPQNSREHFLWGTIV